MRDILVNKQFMMRLIIEDLFWYDNINFIIADI